MNKILCVILFILLLLVGKKRGIKTFITFIICFALIGLYILLMRFGFNAIILAFITCILASIISLFFLNGLSPKTLAAFFGVLIVQIITFILIAIISVRANIGPFAEESLETIAGYNLNIDYNMMNVVIGVYLVSIVGTVIDTSISIATAMNEVKENNPKIKEKELYKSGMNVGGDILSTTINTLFFALVSVFIGFFMWHRGMSFEQIINYKLFIYEVVELLIAFIGSVIIIPVSALISSKMLTNKKSDILVDKIRTTIKSAFGD